MSPDLAPASRPSLPSLPSLMARRRSVFWRIHFWAALIASPFALLATLTGVLYIFTPQIERVLYAGIDHVQPSGNARSLDAQIAAVLDATPTGTTLRYVVPALRADDSTKLFVTLPRGGMIAMSADEHAAHQGMSMPMTAPRPSDLQTIYVDPYSARVLGRHADGERFGTWSKKLHSSLLQGDDWRWMIELAASWLMVMLITGIYLWWPQKHQTGLPQKDVRGRKWWSQWHGFIGVLLSVMSLIMLTTGLTWSKYAGDQVRTVRDAVGQKSPQAPSNLQSTFSADATPLTWQQVADIARQRSPDISLRITAPRNASGVWRINNYDLTQPTKRVDMALDAYSGRTLFRADWQSQTAFGKATGIGIPFHRGEFGWWNQLLLLIFGLGVAFSLVSGWVMFFKRYRAGGSLLPKLVPGAWRSASIAAWITAAVMCAMMPLLALSAAIVVGVECLLHVGRRT